MESIPQSIRGKLVGGGYDSLDKLPNNENMDRWNRVQTECSLTGPELTQLMNIRFPVQQDSGSGKAVTFEQFDALFETNYKRKRVAEENLRPKGPVSRSEWVKTLAITIDRSLISSLPAPRLELSLPLQEHYTITKRTEEPKDKNVKGTRELFGDVVKTWNIPGRTQDISCNNVPTLATHKPDHLMRALGRGGEQSVVVVNEIKPMLDSSNPHGEFSDEQTGQELDFLQAALTLQPWRKLIYGCLTDTRRFEFYRAARGSEGEIVFARGGLITDEEGWKDLQTLLCQNDVTLGFQDVSLVGWELRSWLGSGATSAVFSATNNTTGAVCVCKMYLSDTEGPAQRACELRALAALGDQQTVPKPVTGAPAFARSGHSVLLKTPVGLSIPAQVRLPVSAYAPLVHMLQQAHSRNIYHNDIAPSSVFGVTYTAQPVVTVILNDWGSAASEQELAVLRKVATRKLFYDVSPHGPSRPFGAAADLTALVRTIFYVTQATFRPEDAADAAELDVIMRQQLPIWRDALDRAAAANYDGLRDLLTS